MEEHFLIPGTDYEAYRNYKNTLVYDCESQIAELPLDYTKEQIKAWCDGYINGYKLGIAEGESTGKNTVQRNILTALGIAEDLSIVKQNIKSIAGTLYYHDGIEKSDVSSIAGKEE